MSANEAASSASHTGEDTTAAASSATPQQKSHAPFHCSNCQFDVPSTHPSDPIKLLDLWAMNNASPASMNGQPVCHPCWLALSRSAERTHMRELRRRSKLLNQISRERTIGEKMPVDVRWETFDKDLADWKRMSFSRASPWTAWAATKRKDGRENLATQAIDSKGKAVETTATVSKEEEKAVSAQSELEKEIFGDLDDPIYGVPRLDDTVLEAMIWGNEKPMPKELALEDESLDGMMWDFEGEASASGKAKAP